MSRNFFDDDSPDPPKPEPVTKEPAPVHPRAQNGHTTKKIETPVVVREPPPLVAAIVRASASKPPERLYPSGIPQMDTLLGGGWRSRQLAILVGPPGAGKTSLGCWSADLMERTAPVLYCSTELESLEVAQRIYAIRTDTALDRVVRGEIPLEDIASALDELSVRVLGCDELEGDLDPMVVIETAAEAIKPSPIVVVDYVQQLVRSDADGTRLRLTEVARRLRKLSQTIDGPVLAISSTSRTAYSRSAKAQQARDIELTGDEARDMLATGKESGDLEYSAAVVVYMDVATQPDAAGEYAARLRVAKSRRGRTGDAGVKYHGPTGRWFSCPDAVDAMSADGQAAAKQAGQKKRDDETDAKVLDAVRSRKAAPTRAQVFAVVGGREQVCYASIRRLTALEQLEVTMDKQLNRAGKLRSVEVLVLT